MFALLAQRNFCLLWIAHTISILGDYVFFIAITFWVYQQTGSALATGLVLISSTIPLILFAPLAGMVVDRWDRRSIMFAAESARAVLFLALLGADIVEPHVLWPIYIVGFLQSALAAFFWPARTAMLPQMISPQALLAANALYAVSDSAVRIVAPSLSALALLHLGPGGVVSIDAVSFIISAGCVCLLKATTGQTIKTVPALRTASSSTPGLFFLGSIVAYVAGTLSILFPIFVQTTLSAGPLVYGWMLTAQAIGEGAMSLLLGRMRARGPQWKVIGFVSVCFVVGGLVLMLVVPLHTVVFTVLLNLVFGVTTAGIMVQLLTCLQECVADEFLGATLARYTAVQAFARVGGMAVAGAAIAHVGLTWLLVFDGGLYLLGSALTWIFLNPVVGRTQ